MRTHSYYNSLGKVLAALLIIVAIGANQQVVAQKKNKGRSSITGNKFKPHKNSLSQKKRKKPRNYINSLKGVAGFGIGTYYGDLCEGRECMTINPNAILGLQYRMNESLVARGHASWIKLEGSDVDGGNFERNLSFKSNNFEFAVDVAYNLFEFNKMFRRRHIASPYIFLGMGLVTVNPQTQYEGQWYKLRPLETEGQKYGAMALVFPYGAGVNFKMSPHLDVGLEIGYRWTFTDYLDDVSSVYDPSKAALPADDISRILSDRRSEYDPTLVGNTEILTTRPGRGNSKRNDGYVTMQLRAEYTLKVTHQTYNINSNVSRFRIIKSIKRK